MDSAVDASTAPLGAWAWIRGYFTPATLFLVVNLVIGTIALTSRAATQHQQRRRREREHYYHDHDAHGHHFQEQPLHAQMEQQPGYGGHYYHPEQQTLYAAPPPLARTSSVLDRLRSLGLYRFRSGDFPPEFGAAAAAAPNYAQDVFAPAEEDATATAHYARSRSEPASAAAREEDERRPAPVPAPPRVKKSSGSEVRKAQVARAVPRAVKAVAEDDHSVEARAEEPVGSFRRGPSPLQQEYHYQEEAEYVPPVRARAPAPAPAPLQRTPSVLDRLRSFGLYGFLASDQPASVPASDGFATPADENRHAHAAHYDRSRSEPAPEKQGKKEKKTQEAKSRMGKSSSEARKTPVEAGGECVNARAEAFIDSFRQQQQQGVVHHYQEPEEEEYVPPPAPLSRAPSVLDRLRSFSLYRFRSGDLGPDLPAAAAAAETDENKEAAHYGRSRSEPAREQSKKKQQQQEARMSKSSSSGAVEEETEQCVDARADDFINKFRQQLQLQRLNSLLNYKEMLGGGKQA